MQYNKVERLLKALRHEKTDRVPVTSLLTAVTDELMEKSQTYWPHAHHDAMQMVKLAASAFEYTGIESLKVPFDMTVEAGALGADVDYGNAYTLPQVRGHKYNEPDEIFIDRRILDKGRIPLVLKAISIAKRRYEDIIPVVSSIVGPFSIAAKLFGFDDFLTWIILDPDKLIAVLEKLTDLCILYANEQVNAGCDVVQVGEATCSGDLISSETYAKYIAPYHKKLCSSISVPTVIHICGDITGHLDYLQDTGMSGISFDEKTNVKAAVAKLKGKVALCGYFDTLGVFLNGKPEDVYNKSIECINAGVDVLNAGCSWPPFVKLENIKAMVKAGTNNTNT
jgi:[methyl-Co(III) methanol-specific corrinoid protein]:coenzyme M methyltransferase